MRATPALLTVALFLTPTRANAGPAPDSLLCNEGRTVCVAAAVKNSMIANPARLDVQVNSPDWVELEWEIRDGTGKRLDWNGTKGRMDWPTQNPPEQRTLRILDFILTTPESDRGTVTIWSTRILPNSEQRFLATLSIPVHLTRKTSIVTTSVPEDESEFTRDFNEWWFDTPGDPKSFHSHVKFEKQEIEVMHFAPGALIGITAAAILTPIPSPGLWQVMAWHRSGATAHVTIDGSGWAGVSNWLAIKEYLMNRTMLKLPGIHALVFDRPPRLKASSSGHF